MKSISGELVSKNGVSGVISAGLIISYRSLAFADSQAMCYVIIWCTHLWISLRSLTLNFLVKQITCRCSCSKVQGVLMILILDRNIHDKHATTVPRFWAHVEC